MSEIKLKPCPFCGGGAAIGRHGDNYFIECCKCGSRTWFYKSADKATEAWNRREVNGMSDDLISRKAVLEILYDISDRNYGSLFGHGINRACDVIEHAETAFNKKNVIEELENLKAQYFITISNSGDKRLDFAYKYVWNALNHAIEIVEKGGIE